MTMKKFVSAFLMLCILTVFSAWTDSPIKVRDVLGRDTVLAGPAKRVVSLIPAITEILFAVGAGNLTVGITEFCNYPEETKYVEKVGGFSGATISVEKIVSLKPDLVLVSADMHYRIIALLDQAGIVSFAFEPKNMEDIFSSIRTIGILTGHEKGASETIASMEEKLGKAKELSAGKKKVTVFWEIWDNPLMTSGSGTFINEAISLAGGRNIFDDLKANWPEVSVEQVILRNPEWIMTDNNHGIHINQTALSKRPGWSRIDAVRSNRIGIINSDMIMRAGPRLADAILQMAELIHGDTERR